MLISLLFVFVPKAGLEPARGFPHCPLKTACLPIPPLRPLLFLNYFFSVSSMGDVGMDNPSEVGTSRPSS